MKKVLVVDHNAHDPDQISLYRAIADHPDIHIRVIIPARWYDNYTMKKTTESEDSITFEVRSGRVIFPTRTHRLIYRSLKNQIHGYSPDIVYINSEPENFQTVHAALVLRGAGARPLVFSSWRNIDHRRIGYPYKLGFLHQLGENLVLGQARHGVVFNESARDLYAGYGFDRLSLIPAFVDMKKYYNTIDRSAGRKKKRFRLGFIGRFTHAKGGDTLLHAIEKLGEDYEARFVGSGPAGKDWAKLARKLGVESRVSFEGPVDKSDIPDILNSVDAVVLPSRTTRYWKEQFGRVLIEAMACGIPVIGSSSGEIPWVIGDAGVIFPEGDSNRLAEEVKRLASSHEFRNEMIRRGLERVREFFSLEVVVRKYQDLFLSVK